MKISINGVITTAQWILGVLGIGLICEIENARDGLDILLNLILIAITAVSLVALQMIKDLIEDYKELSKNTLSLRKNVFYFVYKTLTIFLFILIFLDTFTLH